MAEVRVKMSKLSRQFRQKIILNWNFHTFNLSDCLFSSYLSHINNIGLLYRNCPSFVIYFLCGLVFQIILQETPRVKHFGIQRKPLPLEPSVLLREANRRRASLSAGNVLELFDGRPNSSDR